MNDRHDPHLRPTRVKMKSFSTAARISFTTWLLSSSSSSLVVSSKPLSPVASSLSSSSSSSSSDVALMELGNSDSMQGAGHQHDVALFDASLSSSSSTLSFSSSSLATTTTRTETETAATTLDKRILSESNVDMVEFWPFHKKNKTLVPDDDSTNSTNKHNKTKDETCAAQADCSACAVHSHLCHWCAHDNACHSIGSIYGCITGVNCFSNDRCKRQAPDPIPNVGQYARIGVVPMVVALALAGMAFCCVSFGYCLACGIKGAYDDLAEIAAMESRPYVIPIQTLTTVDTMPTSTTAAADQHDNSAAESQEDGHVHHTASSNVNYIRMDDDDGESSPLLLTTTATAPKSTRRIPRHMQRCFNACTLCYVVTVGILGAAVYGTVHYYPKVPVYSVCSDQVAWKSLIDSIAAIKVDASFEILMSVANPNFVDAVLDLGKGTFKHNNAFVGTFEIPAATAKAMSITDLMIIARFTPEKHEALAIVEEYYRGKLILHIDAQVSIRIPSVFNFTYEVDVKDMVVNVNEKDDRSLCKCPTWDDVRNTTTALLTSTTTTTTLQLPSVTP